MNKMYTRYVPQPDGSFQRNRMHEPIRNDTPHTQVPIPPPPPPEETHSHTPIPTSKQDGSIKGFLKNLLPKGLDTGDLLIIILLLLMASDCAEEQNTAMLTLALYLFM